MELQLLTVLVMYMSGVLAEVRNFRWAEQSCPPPDTKLLTRNIGADWGRNSRALYTLPPEVDLAVSAIPNANLGVIANTFIPRFTWLGIYEGDVVLSKDDISDYAWVVYRGGVSTHYVDGYSLDRSNWLRWINCPRHNKEENVWMTACMGVVYYITSRDVQPGDELLVYYGDKYAKYLGLDVDTYFNANATVAKCNGTNVCCKEQVVFMQ